MGPAALDPELVQCKPAYGGNVYVYYSTTQVCMHADIACSICMHVGTTVTYLVCYEHYESDEMLVLCIQINCKI
jgi:hypothetical protein